MTENRRFRVQDLKGTSLMIPNALTPGPSPAIAGEGRLAANPNPEPRGLNPES
jgi:hypothetical protein